MDNNDRRATPGVPAPSPQSDLTLALTVRQLAVVAAAIAVLLAVLIQGRRWRAR